MIGKNGKNFLKTNLMIFFKKEFYTINNIITFLKYNYY